VVVRRLEVAVTDTAGEHYPVEQDYRNLVPKKYAPGGLSLGCLAGAIDYDRSHENAMLVRLIIYYTLEGGEWGSVEASINLRP
jgi:hypothetical protein